MGTGGSLYKSRGATTVYIYTNKGRQSTRSGQAATTAATTTTTNGSLPFQNEGPYKTRNLTILYTMFRVVFVFVGPRSHVV